MNELASRVNFLEIELQASKISEYKLKETNHKLVLTLEKITQ